MTRIKIYQAALFLFFFALPIGQAGAFMIKPGLVLYAHDVALVIMILTGLLSLRLHKDRPSGVLAAPIMVFGAVGLLSLVVNFPFFGADEIFLASLYLVRWFFYALVYFIVLWSPVRPKVWLVLLYGSVIVFAVLGFVQYVTYPTLKNLFYLGWDEHFYRLFSTFFDPNFAGAFLVFGFFLGVYVFAESEKKVPLIISQCLILGAVLLTYSRGTLVGLAAGIIVWFVLTKRAIVGIALTIVLALVFILLPSRGRDILKITRAESVSARLGNWSQSFLLFSEKPLLGFGFNTLRTVQIERGWASDYPYPSRSASGVDNSFLYILITTGVVGLAAYSAILVKMLSVGRIGIKSKKNRTLGMCLLSVTVAMMAHGLFTNTLFYPWVMLALWILLGASERQFTADT